MTNEQFERKYYPLYESDLMAIARRFARTDDDLYEDLLQEARLTLLRFEPAKVHTNERACIRQAVRNSIIDWLRVQRFDQFESLNARLAQGDQVSQDADGVIRLTERRAGGKPITHELDDDYDVWSTRKGEND
jgi:DNA-directed RNA polymerase specialized sigma24 family protein